MMGESKRKVKTSTFFTFFTFSTLLGASATTGAVRLCLSRVVRGSREGSATGSLLRFLLGLCFSFASSVPFSWN
jgi:cytochrome c oxidase assembly factor CtaG